MAKLTFAEFWPLYVREHQRPVTRALHLLATLSELFLLLAAVGTGRWWFILLIPVVAYGLAWFSHLMIEGNHPATWQHPWLSWLADHKMCALMLTGRMRAELRRLQHQQGRS